MSETRSFVLMLVDRERGFDLSLDEIELEFEEGAEPSCISDLFGLPIKYNEEYTVQIESNLARKLY